jgi:hypothetical protein
MKKEMLRRIAFIGKSMLWSFCLYLVVMLAFNWDELKTTAPHNSSNVSLVSDNDANVAAHTSTLKSVILIAKSILNIAALSGR